MYENMNSIDESNVVIQFRNLKVWTPEEKSWWKKIPSKMKTDILKNVTGCIEQGEFAGVIGPSGAGKTTFLVSLAGKCTLPSEGEVMINGVNVRDLQVVEIVPQFDMFIDSLSVMEHLVFMTEMKMDSSRNAFNRTFLNALLSDLKLNSLADSSISSLSGGEKRLLSMATCLLSNPKILICDEPTTGLDSYSAFLVISILKKLTKTGKIVVCSVHQPSYHIFKEFSSVLLMADGKLIFQGTQDQCKIVFESINLRCPLNYNPAEFYIRAVSNQNKDYVEKVMETYQNRLSQNTQTSLGFVGQFKASRRCWLKQVHLLLWRLSLTVKRSIKEHAIQLFLHVIVTAAVLGTCYIGITGSTQRGVQDIRGFLWLITSEVCFGISYKALYVFVSELPLFRREAGMYQCSAYFVARFLSLIPCCIIWPASLVVLSTLAVELPNHIVTSMELIAALIAAAVAALAYGLGMAALFTSTGIMGDVMPCADLPLFLMSGAFLRLSSLPAWLSQFKFLSHFYYAMDAVSNIYWRKIDKIDCPWNSTSICIKDGPSVLKESGYSSDFVLQDGLGLLLVIFMWSILGYCGLKREEKKGYAY